MRKTSVKAYHKVMESGVLTEREMDIYAVLCIEGPHTAMELANWHPIPGAWKRMANMRRKGLIRELKTRKCRITGHSVIEWAIAK